MYRQSVYAAPPLLSGPTGSLCNKVSIVCFCSVSWLSASRGSVSNNLRPAAFYIRSLSLSRPWCSTYMSVAPLLLLCDVGGAMSRSFYSLCGVKAEAYYTRDIVGMQRVSRRFRRVMVWSLLLEHNEKLWFRLASANCSSSTKKLYINVYDTNMIIKIIVIIRRRIMWWWRLMRWSGSSTNQKVRSSIPGAHSCTLKCPWATCWTWDLCWWLFRRCVSVWACEAASLLMSRSAACRPASAVSVWMCVWMCERWDASVVTNYDLKVQSVVLLKKC